VKPYEFITMLCAVAGTGIAVVGMVAYLLTWVTDDIKELKDDVGGLKTEVAAVRMDVDGLKTDVATMREDVDRLKIDVAGVKSEVAVLKTNVATLTTDVDGLKTDVAAVRKEVVGLKTVVGNHAELLAAVSSRQRGPFLSLNPEGEKELTYFQPWVPESTEANEAQSLWAPFLDQLKGDGYNIETLTPSPFSPLR